MNNLKKYYWVFIVVFFIVFIIGIIFTIKNNLKYAKNANDFDNNNANNKDKEINNCDYEKSFILKTANRIYYVNILFSISISIFLLFFSLFTRSNILYCIILVIIIFVCCILSMFTPAILYGIFSHLQNQEKANKLREEISKNLEKLNK